MELDPKLEMDLQREVDAALEASREARDARERKEINDCVECLDVHDHTDTGNPL